MSVLNKIFGKPLAIWEGAGQELGVLTGVPVLGLDALASTGYGPEAALTVLLPLGPGGLRYFPYVISAVIVLMTFLYFSYRQTARAYPQGGGAYIVARENFGYRWGLLAAVCLMLDYLLNVAVGIAAGVGAVVSAVPALHSHTLGLCLLVLLTLTLINLRGVRESGLVFVAPVFLFIVAMAGVIGFGIFQLWHSGGVPTPLAKLPELPKATKEVSYWLLLAGFANGCTAMTGVEAVSDGVPMFREPKVKNARRTLTAIMAILALFLLGLAFLAPAYKIVAMDEQEPGYQTVLSQLVAAVAGRGVIYYAALALIFIVLTYSAQTSFADFPRVCRFLAEDRFLPAGFANRGRRLVYSLGIIVLAVSSSVLLIVFGGITHKLIPLFAVGAFGAFLASQSGMVRHWMRNKERGYRKKMLANGIGALFTGVALAIIIAVKFLEGAWVTLLVVPVMYLVLMQIRLHFMRVKREVEKPVELKIHKYAPPAVIVPIQGWNRVSEKALSFAFRLSGDVTAVHIATEKDDPEKLKKIWDEKVVHPATGAGFPPPKLEIIKSPYRLIYEPILDFVNRVKEEKKDRFIAVIVPELVEQRWYKFLLHNQHAAGLKALLYLKGDERLIVVNTPWYLKEKGRPASGRPLWSRIRELILTFGTPPHNSSQEPVG